MNDALKKKGFGNQSSLVNLKNILIHVFKESSALK